jgi:hypothetical protein
MLIWAKVKSGTKVGITFVIRGTLPRTTAHPATNIAEPPAQFLTPHPAISMTHPRSLILASTPDVGIDAITKYTDLPSATGVERPPRHNASRIASTYIHILFGALSASDFARPFLSYWEIRGRRLQSPPSTRRRSPPRSL